MAQTLIQVKDLKKYYNGGDVKALDGVTVDVYKGDVIAVIGPSGGGKSTFLRSLTCWKRPPPAPSSSTGWTSPARRWTSPSIGRKWAWCSSISICSPTKRCWRI